MNKAELIDVLTERLDVDRRSATDAVEHMVDSIVRAVHRGESVTITGFGVFERRKRAARVARNPRTGETVKVKPTSVPAFRPGAQFKALIAGTQRLPADGPAVKRGAGLAPAKKGGAKTAAKRTARPAAKRAPAKTAAATKRTAAKKAADTGSVKTAAATKRTAAKKASAKTTAPTKRATTRAAASASTKAAKATRGAAKKAATKAPAKNSAAGKASARKAAMRTTSRKGRG